MECSTQIQKSTRSGLMLVLLGVLLMCQRKDSEKELNNYVYEVVDVAHIKEKQLKEKIEPCTI